MKRLLSLFIFLAAFSVAFASVATREHTVERGETLESVAELYNVSPESILEANPMAADMFYTGIVLIIPDSSDSEYHSVSDIKEKNYPGNYERHSADITESSKTDNPGYNQNTTAVTAKSDSDEPILSHLFLTYFAPFKYFDTGYYGIGGVFASKNGFGFTISVNGNWGLGDGNLMYKFGPLYAYRVNEYFSVSAPLRGFIFTYDKYDLSTGKSKFAVNGGITLTPTLNLTIGRLLIGFGYELGWMNGNKSLYHDAQISVGIKI